MSRRIPTKAAAGTAAAPPFANSAASASSSPSSERQPAAWWARRLFRLGSLIFALFWVFPRLYTTWDLTKSEILSAEDHQAPYVWRSEEIEVDVERRAAVLQAFKHSYSSYERDAWGLDNYQPIARKGDNMSSKGGIGYFIVDALDSLLVLGMVNEYERAREWVKDLSFDVDDKFHTFEITIRVLGGLLSAYHLSGEDSLFREKAVDLADRILPAFDSPSGIPYSFINLHTRVGIPDADNRGWSSAAEAGTLQLEFKYLSEITGNPIYWEKVSKVMEVIHAQPLMDGLVPIFLDPQTGAFVPSEIRLGSRGDSYYEYLLKQWLQTNRTEPLYREMYDTAMGGIKTHLLKTSATKGLMYTTELRPQRTAQGMQYTEVPKQDHLVCFLGGSLLLGVTEGQGRPNPDDFSEADTDEFFAGTSLISTCMDTYYQTKTGLAPEIVMFYNNADEAKANGREWFINSRRPNAAPPLDARNILRPETVESLFIAYRVTGNPIYREWGWNIFQAFEKHCKIPGGGYASILDVDEVPVTYEDRMETFWLSETLKYLYLLFSEEDLIPTRSSIFSTEAHIFPVFTPTVVDTSR